MDYIVMEITLLFMEKSWNCVFEFLWEPCLRVKIFQHLPYNFSALFVVVEQVT